MNKIDEISYTEKGEECHPARHNFSEIQKFKTDPDVNRVVCVVYCKKCGLARKIYEGYDE